jgi:hypothetical protein
MHHHCDETAFWQNSAPSTTSRWRMQVYSMALSWWCISSHAGMEEEVWVVISSQEIPEEACSHAASSMCDVPRGT